MTEKTNHRSLNMNCRAFTADANWAGPLDCLQADALITTTCHPSNANNSRVSQATEEFSRENKSHQCEKPAHLAPAGLSPLQAALVDPNAWCQIIATTALSLMGSNALPAVPLLIQCLTSTNLEAARDATWTLCQLRLGPALVFPALACHCLPSPEPYTRIVAARWLAEVEAYRPAALRVIISAGEGSSEDVRSFARRVIDDLPPEVDRDLK